MANFRPPPCNCCWFAQLYFGYLHDIHIKDYICDQFPHKITIWGVLLGLWNNCQLMYLRRPLIAGHLGQKRACHLAPNGPISKILIIFHTEYKFKGVSFMKKIANSCILSIILWAVLTKRACQLAQNGPIKKIQQFN